MTRRKISAFLFICIALCIILTASCSPKEPPFKEPVFFYEENEPQLYALSKTASDGVLSLSDKSGLEYVFDPPFVPEGEYSLEIKYALRLHAASPEEKLILDLDKDSWELPQDLSFLGGLVSSEIEAVRGDAFYCSYAVPLIEDNPLEKIVIRFDPYDKTKKDEPPVLEILEMNIVERWYGVSFNKGEMNFPVLTPFVYASDSNLVIEPPQRFRNKRTELKIVSTADNLSLEAGNLRVNSSDSFLNVPSAFIGSRSTLSISGSGKIIEAKFVPAQTRAFPEPIPADPGMVLAWRLETWRDPRCEIFQWEKFPSVLIFDMADYDVQDRFLKRLAFYVEKAGYRGRIVPYSEISHLHGWNAHDYRSQSLADFFETARKMNIALLDEEKELETILIDAGIIKRLSDGSITAGSGAIISVSRQSPDYLRSLFMVHEAFHGLYFIDESFRDFCRSRWDAFRNPGRRYALSLFDFLQYDTRDTDLVINEFMAYILQQNVSGAASYFGDYRANDMINTSPWRRSFLPEKEEVLESGNLYWPEIGDAFTAEAAAFSRFVNQRFGLEAGRVRTVTVR